MQSFNNHWTIAYKWFFACTISIPRRYSIAITTAWVHATNWCPLHVLWITLYMVLKLYVLLWKLCSLYKFWFCRPVHQYNIYVHLTFWLYVQWMIYYTTFPWLLHTLQLFPHLSSCLHWTKSHIWKLHAYYSRSDEEQSEVCLITVVYVPVDHQHADSYIAMQKQSQICGN